MVWLPRNDAFGTHARAEYFIGLRLQAMLVAPGKLIRSRFLFLLYEEATWLLSNFYALTRIL